MAKSFATLAISIGAFLSKSAVKNFLVGAGLGLASFTVLQGLYATFLSYVNNNFNTLSSFFYAFDLSSWDVGLSMILSAYNIRLYLDSKGIMINKVTK